MISIDTQIDYWYYTIGVNVIPTFSIKKRPIEKWRKWQDNPIPQELFEFWKKNGYFKYGFGIISGKIHRGSYKGKFLVCIDLDNRKGIEEFIANSTQYQNIDDIGCQTMVVQHQDAKNEKAHIYYITNTPITKRVGISGTRNKESDTQNVPSIEVKSNSSTILTGPGNIHKNGFQYEIIGTDKIRVLDEEESRRLEKHLQNIYQRYGAITEKNGLIPIHELFKKDFVIKEGNNRHLALLRIMMSLIQRFKEIKTLEEIKKDTGYWNNEHCDPPLNDNSFQRQWKEALKKCNISLNSDQIEVKFYQEVYKQSNDKEIKSIQPLSINDQVIKRTVELIKSKYIFVTIEETDEILCYFEGVYIQNGDITINKAAQKILGYSLRKRQLEEIKGHIRRQTYHKKKDFDENLTIVNMKNGLYNIVKDQLEKHTPRYLSLIQLPIKFVKGSHPKLFFKFLGEVVDKKDFRTLLEYLAYTFWRDNFDEKFLVLTGSGFNGKSVLTHVISQIHGLRNTANVSIEFLMKDKFALAELENKNINIDTELSKIPTSADIAVLKKITGREPLRVQRKFGQPYEVIMPVKLIFNTNHHIDLDYSSDAFYRRIIDIHFPHSFEKSNDPNLQLKLTTEEELAGLFNVLMAVLRRLLKGKKIFVKETILEKRNTYDLKHNSIEQFLTESLSPQSCETDEVVKDELYAEYVAFCTRNRIIPENKREFFRESIVLLPILGYSNIKSLRQTTGKRYYIIRGIRLERNDGLETAPRIES